MKTEVFENCLYLISYSINEDYSVIDKILHEDTDIVKDYVEPFMKELNSNLLNKYTYEGKIELIKYYLNEFWSLQPFYKQNEDLLFTGSRGGNHSKNYQHTNELGISRQLTDFETYVVINWQLFDMLINEIQISCKKYRIDFFKICDEQNFSTDYFDSSITLSIEIEQGNNSNMKDTRYFLTTFNDKTEQSRIDYKNFEWIIKEGGQLPIKKDGIIIYFYNPQIAYILNKEDLIVQNLETHENTTINGNAYTQTYINAYIEGAKYFDSEYKVSPSTLYGEKADTYVNDLKLKYFHSKIKAIHSGWWYVKNETFLLLTHEVIKEYGFYSGLVSKVEEQAIKYPKLFENFFERANELINRNPNAIESLHYDITKVEEQRKDELIELSTQSTDQTNINPEVEETHPYLKYFKGIRTITVWANDRIARMAYNDKEIWHQVIYYNLVGGNPVLVHDDIDMVNDTIKFPVVTRGFTAFLIQSMGKPEMDIFNRYYEKCLNKYKEIESKKPGSSLRNLEAEFYPIHISIEKESIAFSEKIYPFIDKKEIELINQYIEAYFKYIEQFSTESKPYGFPKGEKTELKLITFKNSEIIDKIHSELKGYFPNKEAELLKALQGEQLSEILLFPHNQNKFVEVFRRIKYNGFLLNNDTETKNWICTTFQFVKKRFAKPQPFNQNSVWDNLNKGKGEPTKKERICITEWLPYKSPLQLTRETENEKL